MFSDTHAPYHDKRAFALMLKVARKLKPHTIIANGDIADFYAVSSHSKDPERGLRFLEEVRQVNRDILDPLDKLGAQKKILTLGNHEDRLRRYLQDKAPEFSGVVTIPQLFNLDARGWELVPYKSDVRVGKLNITHDVGSAGRYNVFKCLDTYQGNILTGHTHRFSYVVEGNAKGEHMVSAQLGWLGDSSTIDYMASVNVKRNWSLGFGVGYLDTETECVHITPVPIVEYRCVVEGVLYRG